MNPFVSPPFRPCPICKENYFGVIGIQEFGYHRRCAKCGYPKPTDKAEYFRLPTVKKKIIYLDQCILSGMVKSLHPERKKKIDPFYFAAFKQLDRLSKLQLIVCPDSEYHESESIFSSFPAEHKRVYELLSHGISYDDSWTILRFQVSEQLANWLRGVRMGQTKILPQRILNGKVDTWQERLMITVDSKRIENAKKDIAQEKVDTFQIMQGLFGKWAANPGKKFDHWYKEEIDQWPSLIIKAFNLHLKKMMKVLSGTQYDPLSIIPPPLYLLFHETSETIMKNSESQEDYFEKLNQFMVPKTFDSVPFVRIFSMIMATFAARISNGNMNKENLKPSLFNDVMMVSTVLPFCDAIFLEKQMAGFLRDNPLKGSLENMPQVYSQSNKKEFLDYLNGIEDGASEEHLAAVREVYGESWPTPFTGVLNEYKSQSGVE